MTVHTSEIRLSTRGHSDIVDITRRVQDAVAETGTAEGQATAFVRGSTAAITTMEFEPGGVHDLRALLDRLIPVRGDYEHNRLNHDTNSHAHQRASLVGSSEVVPVEDGRLALGTWQQLVLIDFDDSPRERTIVIQVLSLTEEAAGPHPVTAVELKAQIEAERTGRPFIAYRDAEGERRLLMIGEGVTELWVGRSPSADVQLTWDDEVSSLHAQLEVVRDECTLVDEGLSRNGSYVNGERVAGRTHLRDGDMLRFGQTMALFRAPGTAAGESTVVASDALAAAQVSPAQRRVLVALCRPFKDGAAFATPPTNQQVADELHLSVDAVKTHMRALFEKFDVQELPQNRKRVAVVERALQTGLIPQREL